jgi:DNA-3-methyladenine glycosylase
VARDLLGCRIVRSLPDGTARTLVIVETEAYLGVEDRACHTWNGRRTPRVEPMWGPGGHAYVYRIYGLHDCFNVVTREAGRPEAVLIRAAVPEAAWLGEALPRAERLVASGPGKLCRVLQIGRDLSGVPLTGPELILRRGAGRRLRVIAGPRVGVGYAGEAAAWPLRFLVGA